MESTDENSDFEELIDTEAVNVNSDSVPQNTKRATAWGISIFKDWLQKKFPDEALENLAAEVLSERLKRFYKEVKKSPEEDYSPSAHLSIRAAIDRYLTSPPLSKDFSIIRNQCFKPANKSLNAKLKHLRASGLTSVRHHSAIPPEDIKKCFETKVFGDETPISLLRVNWFNISLFFGPRGRDNQRNLTRDSFEIRKDFFGVEYVVMTGNEPSKNPQGGSNASDKTSAEDSKMYSSGGPHCPVKYFRKFRSVLNPGQQALFQRPRRNVRPIDQVWYENSPLGVNKLSAMMREISIDAELSRSFTNLCVRCTPVTVLDKVGISVRTSGNADPGTSTGQVQPYCNGQSLENKPSLGFLTMVCFTNTGDNKSLPAQVTDQISNKKNILVKVTNPPSASQVPANIDPTKRYLYLQVLGGKAFLEHLQEPEPIPGQPTSTFTLHLHFKGQRFKSRPAPCSCEPDINEGFLLELQKDKCKMANTVSLLSVADEIDILLIKSSTSGERTLVGSHKLKWRAILASENGSLRISIEINGVGTESKVPVGVLDMKLEIIPRLTQIVQNDVIKTQEDLERSKLGERERLFLVYAKQWWKEFLQIRSSHSSRLVKIFAQDETGTNRLTCSFVKPIRAGRLIDSAREAARFVSLIAYEKAEGVGGGKTEMWCSLHSFLCKNKGDCEDHAILLCNLLLGFGLEAYVTIGTKEKGIAHSWVTTISPDGEVVFWESLTTQRYIHHYIDPDDPPLNKQLPKPEHSYQTIGCIFNHKTFYANCQPSDRIEVCQFDLQNKSLWKAMSEDAIHSLCGNLGLSSGPVFPPICPSSIDPTTASNHLEYNLRSLVEELRNDMSLTTVWDDDLSYLLTPALAGYETEHKTGLSVGNEEFQHAIRRNVPDGHTFKGFPIQFVHMNARRALGTCLRSAACEEIIRCQGDNVRLAVRVRIFPYPELTCAVWVMFACKYRSVL